MQDIGKIGSTHEVRTPIANPASQGSLLDVRKLMRAALQDTESNLDPLRFAHLDRSNDWNEQDYQLLPYAKKLFYKQIDLFESAEKILDMSLEDKSPSLPYMANWCFEKVFFVYKKTQKDLDTARRYVSKPETVEVMDRGKAQAFAYDAIFKAKKIQQLIEADDPVQEAVNGIQIRAQRVIQKLVEHEVKRIIEKIIDRVQCQGGRSSIGEILKKESTTLKAKLQEILDLMDKDKVRTRVLIPEEREFFEKNVSDEALQNLFSCLEQVRRCEKQSVDVSNRILTEAQNLSEAEALNYKGLTNVATTLEDCKLLQKELVDCIPKDLVSRYYLSEEQERELTRSFREIKPLYPEFFEATECVFENLLQGKSQDWTAVWQQAQEIYEVAKEVRENFRNLLLRMEKKPFSQTYEDLHE